jgi:hypothetical protein
MKHHFARRNRRSLAACAQAQQAVRVQRNGVLMPFEQSDPARAIRRVNTER